MCKDILTIGPLTIHGYGLMIGLGVAVALYLAWGRGARRGIAQDSVTGLAIAALVFGFIGAKLLYLIAHWGEFVQDPLSTLGSSGFVVYGGIVLGVFGVWLYCRRKKLDFLSVLDLLLPPVAAAQGFGRLGCFMAGCCFGSRTDSIWAIVFPAGSAAPAGVGLWPVQLFSAAGLFLLAGLLLLYDRKKRPAGQVGALYLLLYGAGRFLIEFIRDDPRGSVGLLSTSQFISLFIIPCAAVLFYCAGKRSAKDHD